MDIAPSKGGEQLGAFTWPGKLRDVCCSATNLKVTDQAGVDALVAAFNVYREAVIYAFETGRNVPQENLRSTMMEEFLGWLFKDLFDILDADRPKNFLWESRSEAISHLRSHHNVSAHYFRSESEDRKERSGLVIGSVMKLEIGQLEIPNRRFLKPSRCRS